MCGTTVRRRARRVTACGLINMSREQQAKALAVLDIGLSDARRTSRSARSSTWNPIARVRADRRPRHRCSSATPSTTPSASSATRAAARRGRGTSAGITSGCTSRLSTATAFRRRRSSSAPIRPRCGTARVSASAPLPDEEDLARALVRSLPSEQKQIAVVNATAPADILTDNYRVANPFNPPRGLTFAAMAGDQRGLMLSADSALRRADQRMSCARSQWARSRRQVWIRSRSPGPDTRSRAGPLLRDQRAVLPDRYDNTQNGANHIHSVLRDYPATGAKTSSPRTTPSRTRTATADLAHRGFKTVGPAARLARGWASASHRSAAFRARCPD